MLDVLYVLLLLCPSILYVWEFLILHKQICNPLYVIWLNLNINVMYDTFTLLYLPILINRIWG